MQLGGARSTGVFVASARLALWPAVLLGTVAFAKVLGHGVSAALLIGLHLCLIASIAFLINDALDGKIDDANQISRWKIRRPLTFSSSGWSSLVMGVLPLDRSLFNSRGRGKHIAMSRCFDRLFACAQEDISPW